MPYIAANCGILRHVVAKTTQRAAPHHTPHRNATQRIRCRRALSTDSVNLGTPYRISVDDWVRVDRIRQQFVMDQRVPDDTDGVDQRQRQEEMHV